MQSRLRAEQILDEISNDVGALAYIAGKCLIHLPIYTNEVLFNTKLAPYFLSLCQIPAEQWYMAKFHQCKLRLNEKEVYENIKNLINRLYGVFETYYGELHWELAGLKRTYHSGLGKQILLPVHSTEIELTFFDDCSLNQLLELSDKMISGSEPLLWGEYNERYLRLLAKSQGALTLSEQSWIDYEKSILEEGFEVGTCRCGGAGACRECNPRMFIDDVVLD